MSKYDIRDKNIIIEMESSGEVRHVTRRTGRPKSEDPKNKRVSMRVNEDDFVKIKQYANQQNITVAQLLELAVKAYVNGDCANKQ